MSIDRRDAIKKIAVGGITVATASAVISSPAFAYDAPTPPAEPVVSAVIDANNDDALVVTLTRTDPEPAAAQINSFVLYRCTYGTGIGQTCVLRTISS